MKKLCLSIFLVLVTTSLFGERLNVVCIHGFMVNHRSMRSVERILEKSGACVYLWNYPSRKRCIQQHAESLALYLHDMACMFPGKPINFVTHSVGGVILRVALNHPACPQEAKIGRAVLLAPPNRGTILARQFRGFYPAHLLMGGKTGQQLMSYDEEVIQRFGTFPETMDILVIAGTQGSKMFFNEPNDGFVTVEETWLSTPHRRVVLHLSHDKMLKHSQVLNITNHFIMCGCPDQCKEESPESKCSE